MAVAAVGLLVLLGVVSVVSVVKRRAAVDPMLLPATGGLMGLVGVPREG
jgi:hypothetical protein